MPERYDDGGLSGGTLERPALQRLLAAIEAGRVEMVVVYKIDRLTRSLADFAKLVERLEARGCSFVSVTQAFNTSSSMGRLTLNVLLSFAQFEREVTAERIRDKIAASKKKGLWMGGLPPLGYDPHPDPQRRELVLDAEGAETVRQLFGLYAEQGCLNAVARAAATRGLVSRRHVFASGRVQGGQPFSRGQIHKLLTNPVYRGLIRHKDKTFPGLHPAIIDQELWDLVQDRLQAASARRRGSATLPLTAGEAALKGLFRDETGDRLTPSHTRRRGKRIGYYLSNRLISGGTDPTGWRLPAPAIEAAVAQAIADHLQEHAAGHRILASAEARNSQRITDIATALAGRIRKEGISAARPLISAGRILCNQLHLTLDREALAKALDQPVQALDEALFTIEAPFTCRRRGVETRIIVGTRKPLPDAAMLRALRHAHRWGEAMKGGIPLRQLATREKASERYMARIIPLIGLSPKIQAALLAGTQPTELTLERLIRIPLPLDWSQQERMLGFTS